MSKKQVESLHLNDPDWIITEAQYEEPERKQPLWLSYLLLALALALIIAAGMVAPASHGKVITPQTYNPSAKSEVFDESNSVTVNAKVMKVTKAKKYVKLNLVCYDKYDGEIFVMKISKVDWKQGVKFRKGNKVNLFIYQNETPKNHKDDIIIHVGKGWR